MSEFTRVGFDASEISIWAIFHYEYHRLQLTNFFRILLTLPREVNYIIGQFRDVPIENF